MADNLKGIPFSTTAEGINFPEMAKRLVFDEAREMDQIRDDRNFTQNSVYVVWFAFTLGNWKALCSTSLPDGRYYEVTYSSSRGVAFVDTYVKIRNTPIDFNMEN